MIYTNETRSRIRHRLSVCVLLALLTLSVFVPVSAQPQGHEVLLKRLKALEQRVIELETTTVLSDPETSVKRIEVFVDENGIEHDRQVPNSQRVVTYQRERVFRRQTINEKIEEALTDAERRSVQVNVDAAIVLQSVQQSRGANTPAAGSTYQLASTDLYFTAGLAQNTLFFADIVGLSGTPQDADVEELAQTNGYGARLVKQNDLSLREAWLMTELWSQQLSLIIGRVDLTNYFDANAAANDETTQFLSDALVNNPALGLSENGAGMALVYDPKGVFVIKLGYQQSTDAATNLSDSLYRLVELGYRANPFRLGEGNYRGWYRQDNTGSGLSAYGISFDQKLTASTTVFSRYGANEVEGDSDDDIHYSLGVRFNNGLGFNPEDAWGIAYASSDFTSDDKEHLLEAYYNLRITEKLQFSFHLAYLTEKTAESETISYIVPGTRLQASF
ncbi:MAG: carbohydrate porin [Gammaproteobacteria bacterium]|nr:carbohydrate porin [Gammaproteobacteria bacterium]